TGTNRKLYNFLNREKFKKKIITFGFIDNIEELMSIADLIITKPGGITTAEALSKGLPMVIIEPLPGQERSNTDYLVDKKVAIIAKKSSSIDKIVKEILLDKERLVSMSESAKILSKPYSAIEIAKLAISLCDNVNI
ncbi:MAG: glycosyltransferase, partial [Candidatus Omnitrophica bacterium]|nr:glycosyltransferase [Candidatus Omnitrophota bacterium]